MMNLKALGQTCALMVAGCISSNHLFACDETDANIAAGERIYVQCSGCHSPSYHRTGPKHCNLLGRRSGRAENFNYTQAMKNSNILWTESSLDEFLKAPHKMIPGTSMSFSGVNNDKDRSQLITYLSTLTQDNPLCN